MFHVDIDVLEKCALERSRMRYKVALKQKLILVPSRVIPNLRHKCECGINILRTNSCINDLAISQKGPCSGNLDDDEVTVYYEETPVCL